MPFERSVGKDTRNTFETADQSSAHCLCTCRCQRFSSKHALQNQPGWPLAFSGRSEQRSDTRWSNALADQSDRIHRTNMLFETSWVHCWPPFVGLGRVLPLAWPTLWRITASNMPRKTLCSLHTCRFPFLAEASRWSIWATLWHALEQRSSWPKVLHPACRHAVACGALPNMPFKTSRVDR